MAKLIDEPCWAIIAGKGTGSVILLETGPKVPLDPPSNNDQLTEEERNFESWYSVHSWCSWRIESSCRFVGSWTQVPDSGDWMVESGLSLIKGSRVTNCELNSGVPDLRLWFGEVCLTLFADVVPDNSDCSYSLHTPSEVLEVFSDGAFASERVVEEDQSD